MEERCKNKQTRVIVRTILLAFVGLLIGLNVYSCNAKKVVGDKLPMPFGFGVSVVLSGSMEPKLSKWDLVVIKPSDNYNVEDIVVYQNGYELIIHRIIDIEGDTVTTMGDSNPSADSPVNISAVKGKLAFRVPYIGAIVWAVKTPVGIILLIAAAVFLLEYSWREEKKNDAKRLDEIRREIEELKKE